MNLTASEIKSGWRELVVKFTCARCRAIAYMDYKDAMTGNDCYWLHQSKLPKGWEEQGYSRIFCDGCAKAFKKFMEG